MRHVIFLLLALCAFSSVWATVVRSIDPFGGSFSVSHALDSPLDEGVIWYTPEYSPTDGGTQQPAASGVQSDPAVLGGQRDFVLGYYSRGSQTGAQASINMADSQATVRFSAGWNGGAYLQYDGPDGDAFSPTPGLNNDNSAPGIDLTFGGRASGFSLEITANDAVLYFLDAINAAGEINSLPFDVEGDGTAKQLYYAFSHPDWTNQATFDWTDVAGVQLRIWTYNPDLSRISAGDLNIVISEFSLVGVKLTGTVSQDCECDNTPDALVQSVPVVLANSTVEVARTFTDMNGEYSFGNEVLAPGTYQVCLEGDVVVCGGQSSCASVVVSYDLGDSDMPSLDIQGDFVVTSGCGPTSTPGGTTQPSTTQPGTTQPGTTQPGTTQPSTTQPGTTQPDTTQPGTTQPSTTQPGTTQPGTTQPGTTQPGTTQPGTTQPGTTQPGTTQPGTTQPGTTQPGTTQPGTTQPGTTQPGTTQPGTTQPGTTQPSTTQPGTTQPGTTQPGTTQPGTTQPGTTQPGTTQPGTTQPGTTQPGTTQPGTTQPGTTQPGTTQPGTTQPGTTQPGTTQPGTTQPGTTQPGTTQPGTTQPGTTQPGTTQPGTTQPGTTQPGTTQPGTTQPGTTQPGTTQPGTTQPGTTQPGTTQPGTTQPGTTQPGTTQPGTTQPGTTQPGTTQPGTTQPGTTQPGTTQPGTTQPGTTQPGTTTPATTTLPPPPPVIPVADPAVINVVSSAANPAANPAVATGPTSAVRPIINPVVAGGWP